MFGNHSCFHYILLCLMIHDVTPFAVNRSFALWVACTTQSTHGSSSSSGSSCGTLSKEELVLESWLLYFRSLGSCGLGFGRVFFRFIIRRHCRIMKAIQHLLRDLEHGLSSSCFALSRQDRNCTSLLCHHHLRPTDF